MAKEKENPNHHMGKHTGYDLIDGEYHIAPHYTEQFDKLATHKESIAEMVQIVTGFAAKDMEQLIIARKRLFTEIFDDIGLDQNKQWIYLNGVISEEKKEKEK